MPGMNPDETETLPIVIAPAKVLKTRARLVTAADNDAVRTLLGRMFATMYRAPGIGLAAPQVGIQKQFFVYDIDDGPQALINPVIKESRGEWVYEEGCLSIPGLYVEILRPKEILIAGLDLHGNEVEIEADELLARLFQHELDHLHGTLMFERMTPEQRKAAMAEWRRLRDEPAAAPKAEKRKIRLT
jgi:peptide deformylase